MRCPKCQYIGFDNGERCRNCGYEFSLSVDVAELDLPIQTGREPEGPLADLELTDVPPAASDPASRAGGRRTEPERRSAASARRHTTAGFELPLFRDRALDDDAPLVAPSAVPRAPLSVRRATPAMPRSLGRDESPAGENGDMPRRVPSVPRHGAAPDDVNGTASEAGVEQVAGAGARLLAAAVDALILGSITAVVLHFTLQLTRLSVEDIALLPKVPLVTFLLMLNGGYFVAFIAAGGQTVGKMATGIRVVPVDPEGRPFQRVPLGQAVLRVAGYSLSLLSAGIGYLPALVGRERRAIHDRLADTRVIKL
jgi:uncharacterized RDD family membrane protein YckC